MSSAAPTASTSRPMSTGASSSHAHNGDVSTPATTVGSPGPSQPKALEQSQAEGATSEFETAEVARDSYLLECFNTGSWSDIELRVIFTQASSHYQRVYRLHRVVLAQSAWLAGVMASHPPGPIGVHIPDPRINEDAFALAIQSLYTVRAQRPLTDANALSVLAAAIFLDLPNLSYRSWSIASSMISRLSSAAEISHWIAYLDTPDVANPNAPPSGSTPDEQTAMGSLWAQLLTHLVTSLPSMLGAFGPGGDASALVAVYTEIPFERFKICVEDPRLTASNLERVAFARKCIAARKARAQVSGLSFDESVVLAIDAGKSGVQVVRSRKNTQRLWKVSS